MNIVRLYLERVSLRVNQVVICFFRVLPEWESASDIIASRIKECVPERRDINHRTLASGCVHLLVEHTSQVKNLRLFLLHQHGYDAAHNDALCSVCFDSDFRLFARLKPYMAPELVRDLPYDESVDLWAVGVLTFELLHGYTPFK